MSDVKIATAADFAKLAASQREKKSEAVTLPSGLTVLAYRPDPQWWLRHMGRMPNSIAQRAAGQEPGDTSRTAKDLIEFAGWAAVLLSEVIVSPVVRLNPAPGELDPALVSDEDLLQLIRFIGGEVSADGAGLDDFSPGGRPSGTGAAG